MSRPAQLALGGDVPAPAAKVQRPAMPAVKHSAETVEWYTPPSLVEMARTVLGGIDLDPASCEQANRVVRARHILTESADALTCAADAWRGLDGGVFINPPGGIRQLAGERPTSQPLLFWRRLMELRASELFGHAVFFAFSAELLQVSQGRDYPSLADFPICAPAKRIRCVAIDGTPGPSPPRSSLLAYVPGTIDRTDAFAATFGELGAILVPR